MPFPQLVCLKNVYWMCVLCVGFPSARLVLSIMGFLGMVNCYTLRVNLSVAIVAMVNTTYLAELEQEGNVSKSHGVCAVDEPDKGNLTDTKMDEAVSVCLFMKADNDYIFYAFASVVAKAIFFQCVCACLCACICAFNILHIC